MEDVALLSRKWHDAAWRPRLDALHVTQLPYRSTPDLRLHASASSALPFSVIISNI